MLMVQGARGVALLLCRSVFRNEHHFFCCMRAARCARNGMICVASSVGGDDPLHFFSVRCSYALDLSVTLLACACVGRFFWSPVFRWELVYTWSFFIHALSPTTTPISLYCNDLTIVSKFCLCLRCGCRPTSPSLPFFLAFFATLSFYDFLCVFIIAAEFALSSYGIFEYIGRTCAFRFWAPKFVSVHFFLVWQYIKWNVDVYIWCVFRIPLFLDDLSSAFGTFWMFCMDMWPALTPFWGLLWIVDTFASGQAWQHVGAWYVF
jgi:hypothetical protein